MLNLFCDQYFHFGSQVVCENRYCTFKSLYIFRFVLINRHALLMIFFVTFSCSYWGVMITLYGIPIFQQCFPARVYHYTHCGFSALVLCLTRLELWQRWSLTSTCEIISRQTLCANEWKTLTKYSWAVSECLFLSSKKWPNAHAKNLNHLPLSPAGHMQTFPSVSLESLCLSPFCCDQSMLQASFWNGFCMSLD